MARANLNSTTTLANPAPGADPIISAIDAFRNADVGHDWLLDKDPDADDPLLAHLAQTRETHLTQLLSVQPTTLAGAAAFALYALEFAMPWADEKDRPMLKAAADGLRGVGVTAPAPYPANPALFPDPQKPRSSAS